MAPATVTSPEPGFDGYVVGVEFKGGHAKVNRSNVGALAYFRRHGYGIDGEAPPRTEPADPRRIGEGGSGVEPVGTKLRDASVDPAPDDFLPPTNAGEANPHGPEVVAPGVHAEPPAPIVPGPVSDNAGVQNAIESGTAHMALAEGAPIGDVVDAAVQTQDEVVAVKEDRGSEVPAKSASVGVWQDYAISLGVAEEDARAMTKKQLLAKFGVE